MSCLIWNCRGLGVPLTVHVFKDLIRLLNPELIFLSETRSSITYMEELKANCNRFGFVVDRVGLSGGLALLWRKDTDVTLLSYSRNHIDVEVVLSGEDTKWRFTGFYGFPEHHQRHRSWDLLRELRTHSSLPWLVGGVFNEVLSVGEKAGGVARPQAMIDAFRNGLTDCDLTDLGYAGPIFTWSNQRTDVELVRCRLDRFCGDSSWCALAPQAHVQHLSHPGSDHVPVFLNLRGSDSGSRGRRRKPWRFNGHWVRQSACEDVVRKEWNSIPASDCFDKLFEGVEACQMGLRRWSSDGHNNPRKKIEEILKNLQKLNLGPQTVESTAEAAGLRAELERVYSDEAIFWKQRSKTLWAREGDRNTSYFHSVATKRKENNSIKGLYNSFGVWCGEDQEIEGIIHQYFGNLFQTTSPSDAIIEEVVKHVSTKVTSEMNSKLALPFTPDEVLSALAQMAPLKSPGPDGLPVIFFQKYWHIIGSNVLSCVLDFLNLHRMPSILNYTFIVLIPKVARPSRITEFRPISLCNVVYKLGAKALANRIKPCLSSIISDTQSAFVPHRLITDNVLVAYELNHFIHSHTQGKRAYMALKLDVSKAYDRIEWKFLDRMLTKLGFDSSIVDLIMICVSTVSFSFLLNGSQFGALKPERGIRQGDPLSPYLFICCVEGFIKMVESAVESGRLKGIRITPSAPCISQLCFADDTILFSQATTRDAEVIRSILDLYVAASGQIINLEKSTIIFSPNAQAETGDAIRQILPFQEVDKFDKYLGLPSRIGKSKTEVFSYLKERLWARVQGWQEKTLSMAGREILIKSVLQAIPTYVMSCFRLPRSILDEVEKIIRGFWWRGKKPRGISWMAWAQLCRPKSEGGLGFRHMDSFNLALLTKQAWRIMTRPELLLSRVMKAKYFPSSSLLQAELGDRPSWTWRSILLARPYLESGLRKRIGNGRSTTIWGEAWLSSEGNERVITTRSISDPFPNLVCDLVEEESNTWNLALLEQYLWQCDVVRIVKIPLGPPDVEDSLYWGFSKDGRFSVRSCYHQIMRQANKVEESHSGYATGLSPKEWKWMWGLQLPPKIRTFLWRACNDILPVNGVLTRRHIIGNPFCPVCGKDIETTIHPFFGCPGFAWVWGAAPFNVLLPLGSSNFAESLGLLKAKLGDKVFILACVVLWKIWWWRNRWVHGEAVMLDGGIVEEATNFLNAYQEALLSGARTSKVEVQQWRKPVAPWIKINFDMGVVQENKYQTAMVARNEVGACLGWRVMKFDGSPTSTMGEARAALEAGKWARARGWNSVMVEGDNSSVIAAIQNRIMDPHLPYGAFISSLLSLETYFLNFASSFVRRSGNSLAHALAHLPLDDVDIKEALDLPADLATII